MAKIVPRLMLKLFKIFCKRKQSISGIRSQVAEVKVNIIAYYPTICAIQALAFESYKCYSVI